MAGIGRGPTHVSIRLMVLNVQNTSPLTGEHTWVRPYIRVNSRILTIYFFNKNPPPIKVLIPKLKKQSLFFLPKWEQKKE